MTDTTLKQDWTYVTHMVPNLQDFLINDAIYMPIADHPLNGTLGGLMLRLTQLKQLADSMGQDDTETLDTLIHETDTTLSEWPAQAEKKTHKEAVMRLNQWATFIDDCLDDYDGCEMSFNTQVMNRVILQLLIQTSSELPDSLQDHAQEIDRIFFDFTRAGEFTSEAAYAPAFPASTFPWLYVELEPELVSA